MGKVYYYDNTLVVKLNLSREELDKDDVQDFADTRLESCQKLDLYTRLQLVQASGTWIIMMQMLKKLHTGKGDMVIDQSSHALKVWRDFKVRCQDKERLQNDYFEGVFLYSILSESEIETMDKISKVVLYVRVSTTSQMEEG